MQQMYRMLSKPIRLHWAGWESDTHRLQQAGWDLSVDQNIDHLTMRIAMRHGAISCFGISDINRYIFSAVDGRDIIHEIEHPVRIQLAQNIQIINHGTPDFNTFSPIDASPRIESFEPFKVDMRSLPIFAPVPRESKEIYLREASMNEILQFALEKQEPMQKEIRERMLTEKRMSELKAQLRLVA